MALTFDYNHEKNQPREMLRTAEPRGRETYVLEALVTSLPFFEAPVIMVLNIPVCLW